ncbi:PKD-like domain-containing protein [Flavobacterium sp.]|uniref:PKD-like domain-containing protein n=1 Tax=Flavobacterium sp. TaxID=239 RepID=UPI0039E54901
MSTFKFRLTLLFSCLFLLAATSKVSAAVGLRGSSSATTNGNSLVINKPAGVITGDIMFLTISQRGSNTLNVPAPAGWTLISSQDLGGGTDRRGTILYRIATAAEAANYTIALDNDSNGTVGAIVAFSGVNTATPFDVANTAISVQGSQVGVVAPGKTTVTANAAVVMFGMAVDSSPTFTTAGWNTTNPGNLTEIYDVQNAGRATAGAAWAIKPAIGATGNGTVNMSGAERNGGLIVILRPALTPPTVTGLSPNNGCAGTTPTTVVITGTNFTGATSVSFNGTAATPFTVNSATQITTTLPVGATTGTVSVTTPSGTGTSSITFTVNPVPTVAPITGTLTVCPTATTPLSSATAGGVWTSGNTGIATVNSSTGLVTGVSPGNAVITYTVTGNGCSNATTATVTVYSPTAVSGPSSVCIGSTIQMLPSSGGTWVSNNGTAASIDTNTGIVTGLAGGTVTFTFTDSTTGCSSTTGNVTVLIAPNVTAHPNPQSVCSGSPATFSISATGSNLTYQWYKGATPLVNGGTISGALTNTLQISSAQLSDIAADYYCVVSGSCSPAATSNIAALNVTERVVITAQPAVSQSLCSGNTATFSVSATGAGLTYQWYNGATLLVNGGNISGATSSSLSISNLTSGDASANYHCVVSGISPCNPVTSNNSALIVNDGPIVTVQPAVLQTVCAGSSVSFSITATGGSLTYQWYIGATPLANGGSISGATTPTLTINPTVPSDSANNYRCVVTNGCVLPANSNNAELVVNERPYIFSYTATTCSGVAFAIAPTNGVPTAATIVPSATTYSWPAPTVTGGMTGGSAESGQHGISQTLINPTNTAQTATYTVTPTSGTSGNCVGTPFTISVTVNPTPFIVNMTRQTCSGVTLTITPVNGGGNIVPAGTTYSWSAPSVTGGMTGGASGTNQASISLNLTNPTNTMQTATYNVTATSGACTGSTFTIAVNINPKPDVAADLATQTICSGTAISAITMSNPNGVAGTIDYNWTRNNTANVTGMPAAGNGAVITGNLTNTTNVPQTTTFTLTATSDEGCISDVITVSVTVTPIPTVSAAPSTQTVCSGNAIATINFSNPNNVPGTTYSWTRDNVVNLTGIAASGTGTNITGNLTNNTTVPQTTVFTITASSGGCGNNTTTVSVIVNPRPDVAASPATQTVCGGIAMTPILITNPNAVPGTTFSWTRNNAANVTGIFASGTGTTITGTPNNITNVDQTVTFTITATRAGCPSTAVTVDLIVRPSPLAVATPATLGVCTGSTANINFSTSNNVAGTTFDWTRDNVANIGGLPASGSGNISAVVTNATAVNQVTTFTIVATAPNGCQRTITATLTVYPVLVAPGIEDSQVVCSGSRPTTFFMTTPVSGGNPSAYTYQWYSSTTSATGPWTPIGGATGATYQPPTTNGATPNTWYQIVVTSCATSVTSNAVSVVVANNNNFNFSIDFGGGTVCSGANFNPRIFSLHGTGAYIRYTWIADPAYISPTTGGPIGDTGCLFGLCLSDATLPLVVTNNTNANVTTTISITPQIYDADTNAFICSLSPQTTNVTIRPRPTATATAPNSLICSGTSAGISVTSNMTPTSAMTYSWTRSANASVTSSQATGTSPTVATGNSYTIPDVLTNTSAVNQNVTYTITPSLSPSGCAGTPTTITITVSPQLLPGTVAANQTLCNGGDPVAFTQTVAATGGGTLTYQWQMSTTSATGPWTDIPGATGLTYDSGVITQTTWFTRVVTSTISGITCSIGNTTPIQVSLNNIVPGVIAGDQTICNGGNPNAFTVPTPASGSGAITYQWQSNTTGCGGTFTNIGVTTATYDVPAGLLVTTYYRRAAISTLNGVPCTDYSNCVTVYVNNLTGGTVGSDETLCGNNPAAFTVITPSTGLGTLTYQWQSNTTGCGGTFTNIPSATSATYDPPAGVTVTTYYRRITTSTFNGVSCSANSNCITVTANSVTAGSIGNNQSVCGGGDPAAFVELSPASGTALTYQWQISTAGGAGPWTDIPSATAATYDPPGPLTVITYYRRLAIATVNSSSCSAPSNFVTVFINNVTPSTVAGDQTFCGSGNPVAFTVTTPATFNGVPSYQWQSSTVGCSGPWTNIVGANSATYDAPVISQTTYYHVIATSTLNGTPCSATSNCITVTSNGKTWNGSVNTDWNTPANWTPAGVPTAINCVTIPNTFNKPYVLGANFVAYAYSLNILSGGALEVTSSNSITVTDAVNVQPSGGFTILNNASLVQINNVANIGNINMARTTQPMYRYDYTYWGSPVTSASGYTLGMLSPQTLADKYFSWNPTNAGGNGNWVPESTATVMNPVKGYIVRAPQTYSTNPTTTQAYTANFVGVPNNGNISVPIAIGTMAPGLFNDKLNLLGNPYPSAVDANLFLNHSTNASLIDGTIYFWTHHSPPSAAYANPFYGNFTYNYTAGDYATYTSLGGTNTVPAGYGGPTPNGYIAAGQAFFVKGLANGNAIFTNAMRVSGNNGAFFRSAQTDKQRVWLNLANAQGGFSQTLVGYADGATTGYDRSFDGSSFSGNFVSFYSILEDEQKLTIQGRPLPFEVNDQVPLGYNATVANTYTIGIDHFDAPFEAQNIYLEDKLLNVIHDLKVAPYSFTSEAGTFNTRFVLRYTTTTLGVTNPDAAVGLIAIIANEKLMVQASENIKHIEIYDISGKLIKTYDPKSTAKKFESEFHYAEGIYIAKIRLENDAIETRKLINSK